MPKIYCATITQTAYWYLNGLTGPRGVFQVALVKLTFYLHVGAIGRATWIWVANYYENAAHVAISGTSAMFTAQSQDHESQLNAKYPQLVVCYTRALRDWLAVSCNPRNRTSLQVYYTNSTTSKFMMYGATTCIAVMYGGVGLGEGADIEAPGERGGGRPKTAAGQRMVKVESWHCQRSALCSYAASCSNKCCGGGVCISWRPLSLSSIDLGRPRLMTQDSRHDLDFVNWSPDIREPKWRESTQDNSAAQVKE
ncbi:hypothetical protein SODALDRAFT_357983 [Sodiomyces alkalinus F11]|uniref:Uncharacterized protein n=1 Tax=Sodiomyces alkalinus (strain CBS 110278 / VKM F-3762 / F11) TaxID=1314773 RepID=A0A3N2PYS1_SODAK|nr:hypothetical protein SODALDRAFT_357983 [Sodiomyces alkalinus F11]ROT39578.1 hypothetical protein SODALDRAFT_357983 [Sodiomyces alkalinus F11]